MAHAAAALEEPATPDLTEVRDLYEQGKAKFETFDYKGAVDLWTRVYSKLGDSSTERQIRNDVIYNIAMAQERAFELNEDVTHLRQAVALLRKYVDEYKTLYQATPEGRKEVAGVEARIAELELRIEQSDSGAPVAPSDASTTSDSPDESIAVPLTPAAPQPVPKSVQVRNLLRHDPEISRQYRSGKSMAVAGGVLLGVGGILFISAVSLNGLLEGTWTPARIGVTASGGALVAGGATLLGIGIAVRRKAVRTAESRVAFAPLMPTRGGGLMMRMTF